MKDISTESPLTYSDMIKISSRLDEIEALIEQPDIPQDVLSNLIIELQSLIPYLEHAMKISEFRRKGLRLIK